MKSKRKKLIHYTMALFALLTAIALIIYPENAYQASLRGLQVWWNIVFPALLPFFIASEVLTGLGVVHFVGVLLEPLMRPLFRVPGVGAFVMAVGFASGYPIGAVLTAERRANGDVSKEEGERLMSCANTADPLFMSGAVAVGMMGLPQVGGVLVAAHYLSSIATGLLMRFYKPNAPPSPVRARSGKFILVRATGELIRAQEEDGRSLIKMLGDAIGKSIQSLLVVGGFIMLFSVLMEMLNTSGLMGIVANALAAPKDIIMLFGDGVLEITIGCQQAAQSTLTMSGKVIAISAIIAWSGTSVHGQVMNFISHTDLSIKPYIIARILHAFLAAVITAIFFHFNLVPAVPTLAIDYLELSLGSRYLFSTTALLGILALWMGAGLMVLGISICARMKVSAFKVSHPRN